MGSEKELNEREEKMEIPEEAKVLSRERYFQLQGDSFDLVLDIVSQKVEGDTRIIEGMPGMDCAGNLQGKPITFRVPANVETFVIGVHHDYGDDVGMYAPKNFILESYKDFMKHKKGTPIYRGERITENSEE